jgi:two-component system chemotaxis response regulator CheB
MKKDVTKVFIVDDSRVARELLTHIIESDPQLKVVGFAENGELALQWLQKHSCDVITMDIHLPRLNGFAITQKIMESKPVPTVIISSGYTASNNLLAFRALEAGALAILEKPLGLTDANYAVRSKEIIDTIKMISDIKVVTRHPKGLIQGIQRRMPQIVPTREIKAVGIGASLGGPLAIAKILEELPASFPVPIFVVQHISKGFSENFIHWLQERSKLKICSAIDGTLGRAGNVYIAADACQMKIIKGGFISLDYKANSPIQPSVGNLFKSLAETFGSHCVGVLLTGMGKDGAEEMLVMKQKGAYTIAQDEESCVMFGMPKEAIIIGAAQQVLPLHMIAYTLNALVGTKEQGNKNG